MTTTEESEQFRRKAAKLIETADTVTDWRLRKAIMLVAAADHEIAKEMEREAEKAAKEANHADGKGK